MVCVGEYAVRGIRAEDVPGEPGVAVIGGGVEPLPIPAVVITRHNSKPS